MAAVTSAVVGIVGGVASAAVSYSNAAEQKDLIDKADREADRAMKAARSRAEIDYFEGLTIPMDAYERAYEQQLAFQKQSVEALQEGDARNLAGGVGRVGAQALAEKEKTRIAMGDEMSRLQEKKLESKDAINQQLIQMDVAAAKEQNQRKRDAEAMRAQSYQQMVSGITTAVQSADSLVGLYGPSGSGKKADALADMYSQYKQQGESDDIFAARFKGLDSDIQKDMLKNKDKYSFDPETGMITSTAGSSFKFY